MRALLHVSLVLFALCWPLAAEDESALRAKLSFQIQELEDIKPPLRELISYTNKEIDRTTKAKDDVIKYGNEVERNLNNNLIKALMSGAITTIMEIHGSSNAGKLIDVATWTVGKAIGLAMEKSETFAGKGDFYTKKLEGISASHRDLGQEVDHLYRMANSSDEAMQAYYNKYGHHPTWDLGNTGTFIQRMRLIVEYAKNAEKSLEILNIKLNQTLASAMSDLKTIDQEIARLRTQLAQLHNKDREEQLAQKEPVTLSEEDQEKGLLPPTEPSIAIDPDMPQGCYNTAKSLQIRRAIDAEIARHRQTAEEENRRLLSLIEERDKKQEEYLAQAKEARQAIDEAYDKAGSETYHANTIDFHLLNQGVFPTGATFDTMLSQTRKAHEAWMQRLERKKRDLENFTNTLLENITTESLDKAIAQGFANLQTAMGRYGKLRKECYKVSEMIAGAIGRSSGDGAIVYSYPFVQGVSYTVIGTLKEMKRTSLEEIQKIEETIKNQTAYHEENMEKARERFSKRRGEMQEEIAYYEKSLAQFIRSREQLERLYAKLEAKYKSPLFTAQQRNGQTSYLVNLDIDLDKNLCAIIDALHKETAGGDLSSVALLEQQIKNTEEVNQYYGRPSIPIDAFVEMRKDIGAEEKKLEAHMTHFFEIQQRHRNMHSNAKQVLEYMQADNFYTLGLLYPTSIFKQVIDKQQTLLTSLSHALKNLLVEVKNSQGARRVSQLSIESYTSQYAMRMQEFEDNFSCLANTLTQAGEFASMLEEIEEALDEVKRKPTYFDASALLKEIEDFHEEVENFYIDEGDAYINTYKQTVETYNAYDEQVNTTLADRLLPSDKTALYTLLEKINNLLAGHRLHIEESSASAVSFEPVEQLYEMFAQHYSNKNLHSLMALLGDDWMSGSDGTTLMDLEDTLSNSFSIFDEIECRIDGLSIQPSAGGRFIANYTITIQGYMYANDIQHTEKSSVTEEISLVNGKAVITKTTGGRFWPSR